LKKIVFKKLKFVGLLFLEFWGLNADAFKRAQLCYNWAFYEF